MGVHHTRITFVRASTPEAPTVAVCRPSVARRTVRERQTLNCHSRVHSQISGRNFAVVGSDKACARARHSYTELRRSGDHRLQFCVGKRACISGVAYLSARVTARFLSARCACVRVYERVPSASEMAAAVRKRQTAVVVHIAKRVMLDSVV
jgi:hypothetical protein